MMKPIFTFTTHKGAKGFTLIELLVVLALFTTVITIATGALFSAQAVNTKLQQTQIILDGVNVAMEEMVRDIRYGSIFYCTSSVPNSVTDRLSCPYPTGNTVLVFKPAAGLTSANSANDRIAYYLSGGAIYRQDFPLGVPGTPVQITTTDVSIETLYFYVKGADTISAASPDYIQPGVTLVVSGVTKPTQPHVTPVRFSVQTSISARKIDK